MWEASASSSERQSSASYVAGQPKYRSRWVPGALPPTAPPTPGFQHCQFRRNRVTATASSSNHVDRKRIMLSTGEAVAHGQVSRGFADSPSEGLLAPA